MDKTVYQNKAVQGGSPKTKKPEDKKHATIKSNHLVLPLNRQPVLANELPNKK